MPQVGFEPTIPVFERSKTFDVLDRAAIVFCIIILLPPKNILNQVSACV
jgi:hypothetical protein